MGRMPTAFLILIPLIMISAVAAQQQQPQWDWSPKNDAHAFPTGDAGIKFDEVAEYKPLTFWSKVTLGSYFFTNPATAHNIEIVYAYRPDELKANADVDAITKLLKEGIVKVGVESKDNKVAGYKLPEGIAGDDKALSEFVRNSSTKADVVYLATEQGLLGATPTGALYTTGGLQRANH